MSSEAIVIQAGLGSLSSKVSGSVIERLREKIYNWWNRNDPLINKTKEEKLKHYVIHKMKFTCIDIDPNGCYKECKGIKGLKIHWRKNMNYLGGNFKS